MKSKSEQVADQLMAAIIKGTFSEKLPSEQELAKQYGISPVTAGKALNVLRDRGVVNRVPRLGTFVVWSGQRKVRIHLGTSDEVFATVFKPMLAALNKHFPHLDLVAGASRDDCDLSIQTTLFPGAYSQSFRPLSRSMVQRLIQSEDYERVCFAMHRDHHLNYGIPITFSPFVWLCNLELLCKFRELNSVYDLTLADMDVLAAEVKQHDGISLFDRGFIGANLMNLIYLEIPERGSKAPKAGWQAVEQGLQRFSNWYADAFAPAVDFSNNNALFTCICRQNLHPSRLGSCPFHWEILPVPEQNGRVASIGSYSVFVSSHVDDAKTLFEVCEAFLTPQVQRIIADTKHGIPVLKKMQLDSMDSSSRRDDVFFSEKRNMIPPNRFFEKDFVVAVYALLNRLSGKDDMPTFRDEVRRLFDFYSQREQFSTTDVSEM